MAIKGKTKGRSRGRAPARAPRREPVAVAPPFFRRRWVQVVAAAVVGAFAVVMVVWVTNGLRQERADRDETEADATRRAAAQEWQNTLEGELGKLGTVSAGAEPTILVPLASAIDSLAEGKAPAETESTIDDALTLAKAAAKSLDGFDLTGTIADQGFDVEQTNYLLNSRSRIVHALRLYEQAALLAQMALAAEGDARVELAQRAVAVRDLGRALLNEGWTDYQQVIFALGLGQLPQPTGIIPGLGLTGPSGATGATGASGASGPTGTT
ncbi:MAG TPA: hypothetical protein VIE12_07500 [Actinomycetota bacterium]